MSPRRSNKMSIGFIVRRCTLDLGHRPNPREFSTWANKAGAQESAIFGKSINEQEAEVILRNQARPVTARDARPHVAPAAKSSPEVIPNPAPSSAANPVANPAANSDPSGAPSGSSKLATNPAPDAVSDDAPAATVGASANVRDKVVDLVAVRERRARRRA